MKKQISALGFIAEMMSYGSDRREPIPANINRKPASPPISKGLKEFNFDENGEITTYDYLVVFRCHSLNLKNALKKFNKFKSKT